MHLAFDIFQGIGIAASVGIRPFLPSLAAGALAAGDVEIHFDHSSYSFLQSAPFLLLMLFGAVLLVSLEASSVWAPRLQSGPLAALLGLGSLALGALLFAGSLVRDHHAAWPGWVAGVICAAIGIAASRPFLARLRTRLDAGAAAVGVPLIADGSALLIAVVSVLAPPLGLVALIALLWLLYGSRRRGDQKYAGLRSLR